MKQLWIPFAQWCAMNPVERGEVTAWCKANQHTVTLDMREPHQEPPSRALDHQFEEYPGDRKDRRLDHRGFNYEGES